MRILKMRKSEVAGTIMMYVMMGIVIVMVIMFGYKQFTSINPLVENIKCAEFASSLEERLNQGRLHGTKDYADINVNCNVYKVCFVDLEDYFGNTPQIDNAIIDYIARNGIKKNVFLLDDHNIPIFSFYVKGLRARVSKNDPTPYVCFVNDGYINLFIQGTGKSVWVSEQPSQGP